MVWWFAVQRRRHFKSAKIDAKRRAYLGQEFVKLPTRADTPGSLAANNRLFRRKEAKAWK